MRKIIENRIFCFFVLSLCFVYSNVSGVSKAYASMCPVNQMTIEELYDASDYVFLGAPEEEVKGETRFTVTDIYKAPSSVEVSPGDELLVLAKLGVVEKSFSKQFKYLIYGRKSEEEGAQVLTSACTVKVFASDRLASLSELKEDAGLEESYGGSNINLILTGAVTDMQKLKSSKHPKAPKLSDVYEVSVQVGEVFKDTSRWVNSQVGETLKITAIERCLGGVYVGGEYLVYLSERPAKNDGGDMTGKLSLGCVAKTPQNLKETNLLKNFASK